MSERKARMAAMGLGWFGQYHPLAYHAYERAQLVCVCDINEERAKEIAQKYGCEYTTDYHEIADLDVDGVSIAVPDFAHFEPAMAMIEAGKHVLVEKPFTMDVAQAKQIISAGREKGVKVMVAFHNRWNPLMVGVKEAITAGKLGKPLMGYARINFTISTPTEMTSWSRHTNPFWFLASHLIDIVRWLIAEEPQEVYAWGVKQVLASRGIDTYDAILALVKFENACVVFESSWIMPESYRARADVQMVLHGTRGRIEADFEKGIFDVASEGEKYVALSQRSYGELIDGELASWMLDKPLRHFVDCILDDTEPLSTGQDGLVVTATIEAAMRSIREGKPVAVDLGS